ncbi:MAG TPA: hypothetical protein VIU15_11310 [Streptomyces sp.]
MTSERAAARQRVLDERELVIRRYRTGVPLSGLAEEYGVTPGWLGRRFDDWGEQRRNLVDALLYRRAGARVFKGRARRRSSTEVRAARTEFITAQETVADRYRQGTSAAALAREFRVSPTFVAERLAEWGVVRRDRDDSPSSGDAGLGIGGRTTQPSAPGPRRAG